MPVHSVVFLAISCFATAFLFHHSTDLIVRAPHADETPSGINGPIGSGYSRSVYVRLLFNPYASPEQGSPIMFLRGADGARCDIVLQYDTQLVFDGTTSDGPMAAGIFRSQMSGRPFASVLRAVDYNAQNSGRALLPEDSMIDYPTGQESLVVKTIEIGRTNLRNSELMDANTGRGFLAETYFDRRVPLLYDPAWFIFGPNFDPGNLDFFHRWAGSQFAQNIARQMGLNLPPVLQSMFEATTAEAATKLHGIHELRNVQEREVAAIQMVEYPNAGEGYTCTEFSTSSVNNPSSPPQGSPRQEPFLDFADVEDVFLPPCDRRRRRSLSLIHHSSNLGRRACLPAKDKTTEIRASTSSNIVLARSRGVLSVIQSLSEDAFKAIGIAGLLAAPCFIILDLVEGDWQAAAFSTSGLVLGALAFEAIAGPVGFLIGGLVGALFSILPSLFGSFKEPPPSSNITKILQYSFFGDQDLTGNEQCNANRKKAGLQQNCTAVYGPQTLAKVFGWEPFYGFAFIIGFNQGYPMSIPDIADVFTVFDYTVTSGANTTASIDCGQHYQQIIPSGQRYPVALKGPLQNVSSGYPCGSPRYTINGSNITIPFINQTAAQVYSRIIPAKGGDCKMVAQSPSGVHVPLFNMTLTGLPATIACNLTDDFSFGGLSKNLTLLNSNVTSSNLTFSDYPSTFLASNNSSDSNNVTQQFPTSTTSAGPDKANSTVLQSLPVPSSSRIPSSDGISSDGSVGNAFVPAPSAPGFHNLTSANAACMSGSSGSICLPNGTYGAQSGRWGFDIGSASTISLPINGAINLQTTYIAGQFEPANVDVTIRPQSNSVIPSSKPGANANANANANVNGNTTFKQNAHLVGLYGGHINVEIPSNSTPPCVCLFSQTQYQNDVVCLGVGGGNLSDVNPALVSTGSGKANNKNGGGVQSLRVLGGANAWIYAQKYNDSGGAFVNTDVADLSQLPYGTAGNFAGNIRALWISPPPT